MDRDDRRPAAKAAPDAFVPNAVPSVALPGAIVFRRLIVSLPAPALIVNVVNPLNSTVS